jgi:lipopolysaccharide/colanic/teichoic acid biosynthesis glycosyltransferase
MAVLGVYSPDGRIARVAKRIMDLVLVVLALPVLLPLLGLCILVIKLESPRDPALFVQVRTGKGGRPFRMYKFRTMVVNAEEMKPSTPTT